MKVTTLTAQKLFQALLLSLTLFAVFSFAQETASALPTGTFVGADARHQGAGSFEIVEQDGERLLQLGEDFSVSRGPDLFVWFVKGDSTEEFVNVGRLQSANGAQTYTLPADLDLDDYDRVIIWCRTFRVLFATAEFGTDAN